MCVCACVCMCVSDLKVNTLKMKKLGLIEIFHH